MRKDIKKIVTFVIYIFTKSMKRCFFVLVAALCCITAAAQDLIVKTDASRIEAKVVEISTGEVRYKRFSNPDGPTYVLPVSDVAYIQYPNGEKDHFTAAPAATSAPVVPEVAAAPAPEISADGMRYVPKQYKVGDLYDYNGVKGIVWSVDESGQHGMIVSLGSIMLRWSEFRKPELRCVGADDRMDGRANMAAVERYIAENNLSWSDFPAFEWCRSLGEGWYLPSIDELLSLGHSHNGGSRMEFNRKARTAFNDALKDAGGNRLDGKIFYFSSTEKDERMSLTSHMAVEPPYVVDIPKYEKFEVRAIFRF